MSYNNEYILRRAAERLCQACFICQKRVDRVSVEFDAFRNRTCVRFFCHGDMDDLIADEVDWDWGFQPFKKLRNKIEIAITEKPRPKRRSVKPEKPDYLIEDIRPRIIELDD